MLQGNKLHTSGIKQVILKIFGEDMLELLDGLLLGDGSLERTGYNGARFCLSQTESHAPWVDQVRHLLEEFGLECRITCGRGGPVVIKGKQCIRRPSYGLRTFASSQLFEQYTRWYPDGKKIPFDIRLTPLSISQWYFGDGGIGGKGYHARFCTDGFTEDDVRRLIEHLKLTYGWNPHHVDRNRILLSQRKDRESLLQMLSGRVPSCFQYKTKLKTIDMAHALNDTEMERFIDLRKSGWSYSKLMSEFGLSKSGVQHMCQTRGLGGYVSHGPRL
jgi:hypothetical protein